MLQQLTESKRKLFVSLGTVKGRKEHRLFIVEGRRAFHEMIDSPVTSCRAIIATEKGLEHINPTIPDTIPVFWAKKSDIVKISNFVTSPDIIGIYDIPPQKVPDVKSLRGKFTLALDDVQDPGNMGTIIRLADWWGVNDIICSPNCVDCYNPKVVQSAMGALARVNVCELSDLPLYLQEAHKTGLPIIGTFMEGQNIFTSLLPDEGIIIMGNEGNGISHETAKCVTQRITIPSFPPSRAHVESLNVATATAIVLSHFRSRNFLN